MIHILRGRDYYITTTIPGVKSRQRVRNAGTRVNLFHRKKHASSRIRERQDKTYMQFFIPFIIQCYARYPIVQKKQKKKPN